MLFHIAGSTEKQPLPGNLNVILVDLDKIVTDTNGRLSLELQVVCELTWQINV